MKLVIVATWVIMRVVVVITIHCQVFFEYYHPPSIIAYWLLLNLENKSSTEIQTVFEHINYANKRKK